MSKLDDLIARICPDGVKFWPLEQCCSILDNKRKPVTKSAREMGVYPYYGANGIQDYVSSYIFNGTFVLVGEDGSVVTPNGKPIVNWAEGKIWVNNHAHIIEEKEGVLLRYLFHYIQTINVSALIHGNIPKLTGGDFRKLLIPIPPISLQQEIVRILDDFIELTTELKAELIARKQQYMYYRDRLFTFEENVKRVSLVDISNISRGVRVVKSQLTPNGLYPVYQNSLAPMGYYDKHNFDANTTYVISAGAAGEIGFCDKNFWAADDCLVFSNLKGVINKYIYYFLMTKQDLIRSYVRKASIPRLSRMVIENMKIPLPSLQEQARIVSILDRFDILVNDIKKGLPSEIGARQKQYEFYRDKLLTFKEVGNESI